MPEEFISIKSLDGISLIRSSESPEMSKKYARAIVLLTHRDIKLGNCVITQDTKNRYCIVFSPNFKPVSSPCDH